MAVSINLDNSIVHSEAVGPQVHRILRDKIIKGDFISGSLISEAEISKTLSTSRQPVREAFIKLREEGLVEVRPQRGTFITKISSQTVTDGRFVREAIEVEVIRLLAENSDPAIIAELRTIIGHQRNVADSEMEKFIELDDLFHKTLADAAGKSFAWSVVENVKVQMDRVRYISVFAHPYLKLIEQHEAIVDAIEQGLSEKADQAMRKHLREILNDLPGIIESRPEMFED